MQSITLIPFNAVTLLVGWQEEHLACKKKSECWFVDGDRAVHVL